MLNTVIGTIASITILFSGKPVVSNTQVLSDVTYSLSNRYGNTYVNDVFRDNILLTLAYMDGKVKANEAISWDAVKADSEETIILKPGQVFAFHDIVLPKYKDLVASTTNAHFGSNEGFKSDGWLVGDGVCHLASFIYAAALKAGLSAEAPTNHNFAAIPDVPAELGVSIYYMPDNPGSSSLQNLYITNNLDKSIAFVFSHNLEKLNIKVEQID